MPTVTAVPTSTTPAPGSSAPLRSREPLELQHTACCLCGETASDPVGVGEDFEYRTSPDSFLAVRCPACDLVYLDPRPTEAELARIYPDDYHAFSFSAEDYGLAYLVRARLETRRLLRSTRHLSARGRILDVGCGDGFHLDLLRRHGGAGWTLQGVDVDPRAVAAGRARGLDIMEGTVDSASLPEASFDLVLLVATIEHVADPVAVLTAVRRLLVPGGRVLVVTDNTDTVDFRLARSRHWGGYHFPRHWNLFNRGSLGRLASVSGLELVELGTICSPVNWTYSVRNALADWGAPGWLVRQFSLAAPVALGLFTLVDLTQVAVGRGALLRAVLGRPVGDLR